MKHILEYHKEEMQYQKSGNAHIFIYDNEGTINVDYMLFDGANARGNSTPVTKTDDISDVIFKAMQEIMRNDLKPVIKDMRK